jgi:hypothetical protein
MRVWAVALLLVIIVGTGWSASADGGSVSPGDDDFNISIEHITPGEILSPNPQTPGGEVANHSDLTPCDVNEICNSMTCEPDAASPLGGMYVFDDGDSPPLNLGWCNLEEAGPLTVTPDRVLTALRHLPLPASDLKIQPPNGRTLVNFDTNFYTDNGEFTRTVTLLGQRVELRIWPARYGWRFGDGQQRWTTTPGDRYPHLEVTHRYLRKGRVSPSVDTTYAAQFRVNGGPWRDVDGTVTIPGTPEPLRVVTARPVLVGS